MRLQNHCPHCPHDPQPAGHVSECPLTKGEGGAGRGGARGPGGRAGGVKVTAAEGLQTFLFFC